MFNRLDAAINRSLIHGPDRRADAIRMKHVPGSLVCGLLTFFALAGCQSFQKQGMQESAKCDGLCAQARAARARGNPDQANRLINEALKQKPGDRDSRCQLAETMWKNGRRKEAIELVADLNEQDPRNSKLQSRLAVMYWDNGQHAEAANHALRVLEMDSQSRDALQIKARYESELGRLDQSLDSYLRLVQLAPDDVGTQVELGDLHLRRGDPERACPLFHAASQQMSSNPAQRSEIDWKLGVAYARSRRWSVAVSMLEQAIQDRKATADDWCLLCWVHLQSGDFTSAQQSLGSALLRDPNCVAARQLAEQLEIAHGYANRDAQVTPAAFQEGRSPIDPESQQRIVDQGIFHDSINRTAEWRSSNVTN